MEKGELEKIKLKESWPLKLSDLYKHYFFTLFPLGIIFIGLSAFYSGVINRAPNLLATSIGIILTGIFFLAFTITRLMQNHKFCKYYIKNVTAEDISSSLRRAGFKNYKYYKKGYWQCITNISAFSWGEVITIIPDDEFVLINSRPNGQPITVFNDKNNIKNLVKELKNSTANGLV